MMRLLERCGPVVAAVVLAAASIPVVAIALLTTATPFARAWSVYQPGAGDVPPLDPPRAVVVAAVAVLAAAVAGGWYGSRVLPTRPLWGVFVTIAVAWAVGVVTLPAAASVLRAPLPSQADCVGVPCPQWLVEASPLAGFAALGRSTLLSILLWQGLFVAGFVLLLGRQIGRQLVAFVGVIGVHAVINGLAVLPGNGGTLPYACLAIGVLVWAHWQLWRERRLAVPAGVVAAPRGESA